MHAAITSTTPYSATLSSSIATTTQIDPNGQPQTIGPDQLEIENEQVSVPSDRELRFLLFAGIPPISFLTACDPGSLEPLRITLYRGAMTIIIVLGIPAAILSFLNDYAVLTAIFSIGVALCTAVLFWAKEYRDEDRTWAPWLFEKDRSIILLVVWCSIQLMICRIPALLIMSQLRSLLDDLTPEFHISGSVENIVFFVVDILLFLASYGTVVLLSDRRRSRLKDLHFASRLILEEIIIFMPRLTLLAMFCGCARVMDARLDLSRQRIWSDFKLAIQHAAGFSFGLLFLIGLRKIWHRWGGESPSQ